MQRAPRPGGRSLAVAATAPMALLFALGCGQTDERPYVWGYISPAIMQPGCATPGCHSRAVAAAGLDLSDPDRGYASLTALTVWVATLPGASDVGCRHVGDTVYCPHDRSLVIPFDPAQSRLVNMLRARGAPRMPPDRPLPEADIKLIETWILDGARRVPRPPPAATTDGGRDAADGGPIHEGGLEAGQDGGRDGAQDRSGDGAADAGAITDVGNRDSEAGQ